MVVQCLSCLNFAVLNLRSLIQIANCFASHVQGLASEGPTPDCSTLHHLEIASQHLSCLRQYPLTYMRIDSTNRSVKNQTCIGMIADLIW